MDNSTTPNLETSKIEVLICKLKEIQAGFRRNLADLHQNIETFESGSEFSGSLESIRKDADARANSLEEEVNQLREQLSVIKELLDSDTKKSPDDS